MIIFQIERITMIVQALWGCYANWLNDLMIYFNFLTFDVFLFASPWTWKLKNWVKATFKINNQFIKESNTHKKHKFKYQLDEGISVKNKTWWFIELNDHEKVNTFKTLVEFSCWLMFISFACCAENAPLTSESYTTCSCTCIPLTKAYFCVWIAELIAFNY